MINLKFNKWKNLLKSINNSQLVMNQSLKSLKNNLISQIQLLKNKSPHYKKSFSIKSKDLICKKLKIMISKKKSLQKIKCSKNNLMKWNRNTKIKEINITRKFKILNKKMQIFKIKRIVSHGNYKNKLPYSMIKFNMQNAKNKRQESNFKILNDDWWS